mmetsp:Transcript_29187/g.40131  ORF Transcript_29187/g.40131 Transcript_29187/m.40131 type:complete len:86 (-) Transcript_29187:9-266(-)
MTKLLELANGIVQPTPKTHIKMSTVSSLRVNKTDENKVLAKSKRTLLSSTFSLVKISKKEGIIKSSYSVQKIILNQKLLLFVLQT